MIPLLCKYFRSCPLVLGNAPSWEGYAVHRVPRLPLSPQLSGHARREGIAGETPVCHQPRGRNSCQNYFDILGPGNRIHFQVDIIPLAYSALPTYVAVSWS